jgi:hypothetical protein
MGTFSFRAKKMSGLEPLTFPFTLRKGGGCKLSFMRSIVIKDETCVIYQKQMLFPCFRLPTVNIVRMKRHSIRTDRHGTRGFSQRGTRY